MREVEAIKDEHKRALDDINANEIAFAQAMTKTELQREMKRIFGNIQAQCELALHNRRVYEGTGNKLNAIDIEGFMAIYDLTNDGMRHV